MITWKSQTQIYFWIQVLEIWSWSDESFSSYEGKTNKCRKGIKRKSGNYMKVHFRGIPTCRYLIPLSIHSINWRGLPVYLSTSWWRSLLSLTWGNFFKSDIWNLWKRRYLRFTKITFIKKNLGDFIKYANTRMDAFHHQNLDRQAHN